MRNATQNNFSALRLLLALMVVFGHFKTLPGLSPADGWFGYGDLAVDAFFIVSGYLIAGSIDRQPHLLGFYVRRFFRIYPLYLVFILGQAAIMLLLLENPAQHTQSALRYLAVNAVFANFMQYDIGGLLKDLHNPGINPSLWTLKVEVGFYAILPFLWLLYRRWRWGVLVGLYLASVGLTLLAQELEMGSLSKQLPCQLRFFVVGMGFYIYGQKLKLPPWCVWLSVLGLFIFCSFRRDLPLLPLYYPLAIGLLVYLAAERLPALPMRLDLSYGVYLAHGPLIQLALLLGWFADTMQFLLILVVASLAIAWIAELCIERPGIALGKKFAELSQRSWPKLTLWK
jgi:peptidoglycan/LPS O-acetylase OafA/YrhL